MLLNIDMSMILSSKDSDYARSHASQYASSCQEWNHLEIRLKCIALLGLPSSTVRQIRVVFPNCWMDLDSRLQDTTQNLRTTAPAS